MVGLVREVKVWFLVAALLISFYMAVIPTMELVSNNDLLKSLSLYDGGNSVPTDSFEVSDVVVFRVDVEWANLFSLVVFNQTCDVFSKSGDISGSRADIPVSLYPPEFRAKSTYGFRLCVYARNFPVLGAMLSDMKMGAFSVDAARTSLRLNVSFDQESFGLSMHSVLVNDEFEPIVNQSVSFYLQTNGNDTSLPDRGWVSLGSARTDEVGVASLNVVCNIGGGCHKVEARFDGEGFESSVADAFFVIEPTVPVVRLVVESFSNGSKMTAELTDARGLPLSNRLVYFKSSRFEKDLYALSDVNGSACVWVNKAANVSGRVALEVSVARDRFTEESVLVADVDFAAGYSSPKQESIKEEPFAHWVVGTEVEPLFVRVNTTRWVALLENTISAYFFSDVDLGNITFYFLLDGEGGEVLGHGKSKRPMHIGAQYFYQDGMKWIPRESRHLGSHSIWVVATDLEGNLVAEGSVNIEILRCPCNIRALFPSGFVGEDLEMVLAYALPRVYQPTDACSYVHTYRLAPTFEHDNNTYMVDDVSLSTSVLVKVYVNDILKTQFPMSQSGVAYVPLGVDFQGIDLWNVTVVVDPGVTTQNRLTQYVTLTDNQVKCGLQESDNLNFSCTVSGLNDYAAMYTHANVTIKSHAGMFDDPLMNVLVSDVFGRQLRKGDSSESLPPDVKLLFFSRFYNKTSSTAPSCSDLNRDGRITLLDLTRVSGKYGWTIDTVVNWTDVDANDIDGDGSITILDISRITGCYGGTVRYLSINDPRTVLAIFYNSYNQPCGQSFLDIQGGVRVPSASVKVKLFLGSKEIGAMFKQFNIVSDTNHTTDYCGDCSAVFSASVKGVYVARSRVLQDFEAIRVRLGVYASLGETMFSRLNLLKYFCVMRSITKLSLDYFPKNVTGDAANVIVAAYLTDTSSNKPLSGGFVSIAVNPGIGGGGNTNRSGIVCYSFDPDYYRYKVDGTYDGNSSYFGSSQTIYIDARYFTSLNVKVDADRNGSYETTIGNCTSIGLAVGQSYNFKVNTTPNTGNMGRVKVYVNGVFKNDIAFSDVFTWPSGSSPNTFYFNITYVGGDNTRLCHFSFMVRTTVYPLMVYFDVTPVKFKPGDSVSLRALAVVAYTNQTFTGGLVFDFLQDGSPDHVVGHVVVNQNQPANASVNWAYPNDGVAHTIVVVVCLNNGSAVKHMVEPVTLEVYRDTRLLFWVERDNSSKHTFHGKLVTTTGGVVANQPVKAYLNDTQIAETLTTGSDGCFSFERNFDPTDKKVSYVLKVVFEGTSAKTATLNGTDLEGKPYTLCQTTQFNFKPSANMSTVVVEPQATQVTVPTKTPEQIQQEAQNNGELRTYTWSSIWYPWFRTHFVAALNGEDLLDIGLSILPCGDIVVVYSKLKSWIADAINTIIIRSIATAYFTSWVLTEIALQASMFLGWIGFTIGFLISLGVKTTLLSTAWNSAESLKGSFVGTLFSWGYGLISTMKTVVDLAIACLTDFLALSNANFWNLLYKFIWIPLNAIFLIGIITRVVELGGWQL